MLLNLEYSCKSSHYFPLCGLTLSHNVYFITSGERLRSAWEQMADDQHSECPGFCLSVSEPRRVEQWRCEKHHQRTLHILAGTFTQTLKSSVSLSSMTLFELWTWAFELFRKAVFACRCTMTARKGRGTFSFTSLTSSPIFLSWTHVQVRDPRQCWTDLLHFLKN